MTKTEPASAEEVLRAAEAHRRAFGLLSQYFYAGQDLVDMGEAARDEDLYVPAIVLGGFAAELYLKAIDAKRSGELLRTHALIDLWERLDPEDQALVLSEPTSIEMLPGFFQTLPRIGPAFDSFADRNPRIFEDWRYYWTKSDVAGIDPNDLNGVLLCLSSAAKQRIQGHREGS